MSTTFAIIIQNRMNNKIRIDIAHRSSAGGGKVNIEWLNDLAPYIDKNTIVHAMDNTAQGVKNMGDLFTLSKHGNFNGVNDKSIDDKIEALEEEVGSLPSVVNSIYKEIKANRKRIKAVEKMFDEINEINYINNKTKRSNSE